jgi:uncharacterized protein YtpQ (UPF0354 family)
MSGKTRFADRAIAYVKGLHPRRDDQPVLAAAAVDLVSRPLAEDMAVFYLVDLGNVYKYVTNWQLADEGVTPAELHEIAIRNLTQLIIERDMKVDQYQDIFAVMMGGDFEASVLLLDQLWDDIFRQFVDGDYAIAVPARDYLAFCDSSSKKGIQQLRQLIRSVPPDADHLISDRIYIRSEGSLTPLKD